MHEARFSMQHDASWIYYAKSIHEFNGQRRLLNAAVARPAPRQGNTVSLPRRASRCEHAARLVFGESASSRGYATPELGDVVVSARPGLRGSKTVNDQESRMDITVTVVEQEAHREARLLRDKRVVRGPTELDR